MYERESCAYPPEVIASVYGETSKNRTLYGGSQRFCPSSGDAVCRRCAAAAAAIALSESLHSVPEWTSAVGRAPSGEVSPYASPNDRPPGPCTFVHPSAVHVQIGVCIQQYACSRIIVVCDMTITAAGYRCHRLYVRVRTVNNYCNNQPIYIISLMKYVCIYIGVYKLTVIYSNHT